MIDEQFLTDQLWVFSRANGEVITNALKFCDDGQLKAAGVMETSWRLDEEELVLMLPGEIATTRFRLDQPEATGNVRLSGAFELQPDTNVYHTLQPALAVTNAPTYPLTLIWREEFNKFLSERRIYTQFPFDAKGAYSDGQVVTIDNPASVEAYANLPIGSFCTIGAFSYSISRMHPGTTIGRYCSIAHNVSLMGDAHPTDRVTTSAMTYAPSTCYFAYADRAAYFQTMPFDEILSKPVTIGHDVWIGADALLKGGITIGTGAIIGARAIVTRDVPPYSIVAGSPATVRKMRFPDAVIERLLASRWWDYDFSQLPACWNEPERFIDELEAGILQGSIQPFNPATIDLGSQLLELERQYQAAKLAERATASAQPSTVTATETVASILPVPANCDSRLRLFVARMMLLARSLLHPRSWSWSSVDG